MQNPQRKPDEHTPSGNPHILIGPKLNHYQFTDSFVSLRFCRLLCPRSTENYTQFPHQHRKYLIFFVFSFALTLSITLLSA